MIADSGNSGQGATQAFVQVQPTVIWTHTDAQNVRLVAGTSSQPAPQAETEQGGKSVGAAEQEQSQREVFLLDVGFKNDPVEVEYEGQIGLICEGYASKYNEEDAAGETQLDGSFSDIAESWGAQKEPLVLYNHGLDTVLGARPIGRGIAFKHLPDGLYVKVFVPRDAADNWKDKRAQKKFKEVYSGVKSALIRAFSVGGSFIRYGSKLARWSTTEISLTPTPCLSSATFSLGSKAVIDRYGAVPVGLGDVNEQPAQEQNSMGILTRAHWNSAMGLAKKDGAAGLHDHLLGYEPALQGQHDSEDCALCADRRDMMGVKAQSRDAYLVAEGDNPSEWHLPVKKGGTYDRGLCGAAWAALHKGYRGNKYEGPKKAEALAKLKRIYKSQGWDVPGEDGGAGGKSDEDALDADAVVQQATEFLAEFAQGAKSGRRHSKETLTAINGVIEHLHKTFGLGPYGDDAKDDGDA